MRLDKFLSEAAIGTRSQVKAAVRKGQVTVNGTIITRPEYHVDPDADTVAYAGTVYTYEQHAYYMLNKPAGVVTAVKDNVNRTVMDLFDAGGKRKLAPVGRLDKDTEGLLIITDDGMLSHRLCAPAKHVDKTYLACLEHPLTEDERHMLETGVDIGDEKPTLPAVVRDAPAQSDLTAVYITIREGRYHQIKRMLHAVDNQVIYLKRLSIGGLRLDEELKPGEYRSLTAEEIRQLQMPARRKGDVMLPDNGQRTVSMFDKKAFIFDLDGTLVDSMWIWKQIDIEYLGQFGIPLPDDLQRAIEGKSFIETASYFKERFALPCTIEEIMQTWNTMSYEKYIHEVSLKPGAKELLEHCRAHNIRLGIATSNSRHLVEALLRSLQITDYFPVVMTSQEVAKGKPAPDIYLEAARMLHTPPEDCLVFEDITAGIMAGRNAGMAVCAVQDVCSMYQDEEKRALADYYITDFTEVLRAEQGE